MKYTYRLKEIAPQTQVLSIVADLVRQEDIERVVATTDGLLTNLHEPEASHLDLLSAFLPPAQIRKAYAEAVQRHYPCHEFGDLNIIV